MDKTVVAMPHFDEDYLTPQDIAAKLKVHPKTIQRMFIDEPGVLILGEESRRDGKRQYVTLRIPPSVAKRVLSQKTRRLGQR
jgi:hypothetical protein